MKNEMHNTIAEKKFTIKTIKNNKRLFPKCLKIVFLTVALARYLFYQNDYRIVMQGK